MRASGILMPISSLPSPYGIGTMGAAARSFVDFFGQVRAGILADSARLPHQLRRQSYQSFSTLRATRILSIWTIWQSRDCCCRRNMRPSTGNAPPTASTTAPCTKSATQCCAVQPNVCWQSPVPTTAVFVKENDFWLPDYALFMALKDAHNGACWLEWEEPLRRREPAALEAARQQYADDVAFWQAVQFMFYSQWQALKHYANRQEICIIGDLPIYVALDSVDVWSCPQEFQLDENLLPTEVAGCRRTLLRHRPAVGTRCSTGTPWPRPDTHGGGGASNTCAASMMWFALTTSADLRAIMLSPTGKQPPGTAAARRSRLCAVCCHKEKAGQPAHHRRGFGIPDGRCHCPAEAMRLSRHESAGICL